MIIINSAHTVTQNVKNVTNKQQSIRVDRRLFCFGGYFKYIYKKCAKLNEGIKSRSYRFLKKGETDMDQEINIAFCESLNKLSAVQLKTLYSMISHY